MANAYQKVNGSEQTGDRGQNLIASQNRGSIRQAMSKGDETIVSLAQDEATGRGRKLTKPTTMYHEHETATDEAKGQIPIPCGYQESVQESKRLSPGVCSDTE